MLLITCMYFFLNLRNDSSVCTSTTEISKNDLLVTGVDRILSCTELFLYIFSSFTFRITKPEGNY